jgi:hypothetical protein
MNDQTLVKQRILYKALFKPLSIDNFTSPGTTCKNRHNMGFRPRNTVLSKEGYVKILEEL